MVMHTISIAGGTRLGTVTNGIMTLGLYGAAFIGGFVEQLGTFGGIQAARMVGVTISLFSPADSMWRLATYYLQPDITRALGNAGPFTTGSVPSAMMVWWTLAFIAAALAFAIHSFRNRQL
jgi:Cu-processing system permease protein